jgi:hypothetical protein
LDISKRVAQKSGTPVDGDYTIEPPDPDAGNLEVSAFDWKEGMQYWWTCEYDAFGDQTRMEAKQIVIKDAE